MRTDLPLGLMAAQVTHAAGESSPGNLPEGTHAVVLGCTADELRAFARALAAAGVSHVSIFEDDAPYGELMAVGLKPAPKAELRRHVRHMRLLGAEDRSRS